MGFDFKKMSDRFDEVLANITQAEMDYYFGGMKIVDLKDSPYANSIAKNGFDSVSSGLVIKKSTHEGVQETPHCIKHGAMNKVDPSGLWRCLTCNVGCYQTEYTKP